MIEGSSIEEDRVEIKSLIQGKLERIEKSENVKICLAVESGSRAWGFASSDSDYDCRFIYVRPKEDYLRIFERKDTLTYVPDAVFDLDGWDIKKVITHIVKSNAVMTEWLLSPEVYFKDEKIWAMLWNLAQTWFNPVAAGYHYLNMAKKKHQNLIEADQFKLKGYFYILRSIIAVQYIMETGRIPSTEFQKNLQAVSLSSPVQDSIENLLLKKAQMTEKYVIDPHPILVPFFNQSIKEIEQYLQGEKFEKPDNMDEADYTYRKIIDLMWEYE